MPYKIFAFLLLTCLTLPCRAADIVKQIEDNPKRDIFITTSKEDISILAAPQDMPSTIQWQKKLCEININKPADNVIEITVTPKKQNAFVKKILRIPRTICSVRLFLGAGRNIYASSEIGDIRFFSVEANNAKLYTTQGVIEVFNYKGQLSAETLTSRITLENMESEDLKLKTASGNIYASGLIVKNTDILNTSGNSKVQGIMEGLSFYSSEGSLYAKWDALPQNKLLNISARSFAGDIKIAMPRGADIAQSTNNIELKSIYGTARLENN